MGDVADLGLHGNDPTRIQVRRHRSDARARQGLEDPCLGRLEVLAHVPLPEGPVAASTIASLQTRRYRFEHKSIDGR